jgi:hypothetical protein
MGFLGIVIFLIIIVFIWILRQPVVAGFLILAYLVADKLHKKEADKIIRSINKLDDDEILATLKLYRRKFLGLKLFGFFLLLCYAFVTAGLVYIFIHVGWVWYLVFGYILLAYWGPLVRNISINYLAFHESRMNGN